MYRVALAILAKTVDTAHPNYVRTATRFAAMLRQAGREADAKAVELQLTPEAKAKAHPEED